MKTEIKKGPDGCAAGWKNRQPLFIHSFIFPVIWRDRTQHDYLSPCMVALSKLMDRLPFGASFDINPRHWIRFELGYLPSGDEVSEEQVWEAYQRIAAFITRWTVKGVFDSQKETK